MSTKVLVGPHIRTALPGPNAKRVLEGDAQYISPSYTRSYPLVAKRGRGIVVTDVDGNEFFDFSAGIAVTSTGHCHPGWWPRSRSRRPNSFTCQAPISTTRAWLRSPSACRKSLPCPAPTGSTTAIRAPRPSSAR